ncbi:TetR/AcrR family transcriptional regulator [Streptomyces sp. NPDC001691]|uniref:TetR/AcrR family transcriptional regulator n=1 Tax=Streptomyces sp. NPDC001691 TaxID=3364600 RepID=UPI0036AC141C
MSQTGGVMDDGEARARLLDAADALFYTYGVQAVGMDRIRAESRVPLKRLYRLFPAKEALVAAYLDRHDQRWTAGLRRHVEAAPAQPRERVLAVFDWLAEWFAEPAFRGCAFLNALGELGETPAAVNDVARRHKAELRRILTGLATAEGSPALGDQLMILVEGATAVAALDPGPAPAHRARSMAETLLDAGH